MLIGAFQSLRTRLPFLAHKSSASMKSSASIVKSCFLNWKSAIVDSPKKTMTLGESVVSWVRQARLLSKLWGSYASLCSRMNKTFEESKNMNRE